MQAFSFTHILSSILMISNPARLSQAPVDRSALALYDLAAKNPTILKLAKELKEISGLAMSDDGRLFAHDDERGLIYQIDSKTGDIVKQFYIGYKPIKSDFEGIAIIGKRICLVTSDGRIYICEEAKNNERANFNVYRTGLTARYNVEGLCYDPDTNSLLLACKDFPGKGFGNSRAVYSFSLERKKLDRKPRFLLPLKTIEEQFGLKEFKPSGIERHPKTGSFLVLSSHEPSIIEVSPRGELVGYADLPRRIHGQPEGITVAPDGTLLISNEGTRQGTIVKYPMEK